VKARLFTDGGARGNPGPAASAYVVETEDGTVLAAHGEAIGNTTNNVAEYHGLLAALDWCVEQGAKIVAIRSDSLLLVQQMRGVYKVKNDGLKPLHGRARLLAHKIGRVTFEHVPREKNKDADRLANQAMDEAEESSADRIGD